MKPIELVLTTAIGGACMAALFGNMEAIWLQSSGAPELFSLVYSSVLYGLIGAGIAFGAGVAFLIGSKIIKKLETLHPYAFSMGASAALIPMGAFVLRYQLNKVLYAEQGVPMSTLLIILVGLALVCALTFFINSKITLNLKRGALLWLESILFMGAISATSITTSNPAATNHDRSIPEGMENSANVIFMMIDTLRADHVGAYQLMDIRTPNIDALAKDGLLFERCTSQASWTRPSGVSMFTGRIPSGHSTQTKAARVPDEAVLFSEVLSDNGITTGALANNINLTASFNLNQGFDTFIYEAPNYPFGGTESIFGLTFYKAVAKVLERLSPEHREVENYYQPAEQVFTDAKAFIEANKASKWMLYTHIMEPHDPYFEHPNITGESDAQYNGVAYGRAEHEHPDPNDTEYLKKVYKQEIEFLDLEIGRFVEWLKTNGHYDNTMIVIISDHGEEFNEHGGFWHGTTLYDEVLHVPLIIKTPQNGLKNKRIPWQVRSIDVAPTIVENFGLNPDESWDGVGLMDDIAYLESTPKAVDQCTPHPLARIAISENDFEGNILASIRMNGWKYILANKDNPRGLKEKELYALLDDSQEMRNLMDSPAHKCESDLNAHSANLHNILGEVLKEAQNNAATGKSGELDEATIDQMQKLGYMEQ